MQELSEFLLESLNIKTKKLSGTKKVEFTNNEMSIDFSVESDRWNLTTFKTKDGDAYRAYWSVDSAWILYVKDGSTDWAAVAPADIKPVKFSDRMFNNFDQLLADGATIPTFDEIDVDDFE